MSSVPKALSIALLVLLLLESGFIVAIPSRVSTGYSPVTFSSSSYEMIEHPLPNGSGEPWGITTDRSGMVWFVQSTNQIGMYNPETGKFAEYPIPTPSATPENIAVDSSGNVWITELAGSKLGELKQGTSTVVEYTIPKGPDNLACGPIGVTARNDDTIWLTCEFSNQIDEFFPENMSFFEYNLPVFFSAPLEIVFDSSGNFWFTAADAGMLGYATVSELRNGTTSGLNEFAPVNSTYLHTYDITDPNGGEGYVTSSLSTPSQIALSPDGTTLWITEHTASSFDRYDIATKTLTKYWTDQTNSSEYSTSLPNGIAVDSSGNVWIAEHYGNRIAEFKPSKESLIEFPIPCCNKSIAGTLYLALGKNGTVWFTEFFGNAIGELMPISSSQSASDLTLSLQNETMTAGQGALNTTLNLELGGSSSSSVALGASGISSTGALNNLIVSFSPGPDVSLLPGKTASVRLDITDEGLNPGIYYITLSAKLAADGSIHSIFLKIIVPSNIPAFQNLMITGAAIGIVGSALVVSMLAIKRRSKVRHKMAPRRVIAKSRKR